MKRVNFRIDSSPGEEPGEFTVKFNDKKASSIIAGCVRTWELRVDVKQQIPAGRGFVFELSGFLPAHRTQDYNPRGRDYVSLEFSSSTAKLELIVNSEDPHHIPSFARILVSDGELIPGDSVVLRIGVRRWENGYIEIRKLQNSLLKHVDVTLNRVQNWVKKSYYRWFNEMAFNWLWRFSPKTCCGYVAAGKGQ